LPEEEEGASPLLVSNSKVIVVPSCKSRVNSVPTAMFA